MLFWLVVSRPVRSEAGCAMVDERDVPFVRRGGSCDAANGGLARAAWVCRHRGARESRRNAALIDTDAGDGLQAAARGRTRFAVGAVYTVTDFAFCHGRH